VSVDGGKILAMEKGDRVVAVKDIGGVLRELVPKGSVGVVTQCGWTRETRVLFTIRRPILGDRQVEVRVENGEVR
jgi:hypothetical protein